MHAARALYLDASPLCSDSPLPNAPGAFSHRRTFTAPMAGRVLGLAGHMHDGGRRLTLKNETTGKPICEAVGGYGGPGFEEPAHDGHAGHGGYAVHLSSVGQCISPAIDRPFATIGAGHQLTIETFYENPNDPSFHDAEEVMGVFFMYVLQE